VTAKTIKIKDNISVEFLDDKDSAIAGTASYLNDLLSTHIDSPILLLLAGGSSVSVLDHINPEYLSELLTVTVTDDRYSKELDENNFSILQTTSFYNGLIQVDAFCINTQVFEVEDFESYRSRFEKNIRDWKMDFPKGKIIALYGMGSDGHTAGIIPGVLDLSSFVKEFDSTDRLIGKMDAGDKNPFPLRVSTTLSFMRDWVDHAVFFISGQEKDQKLKDSLSSKSVLSGEINIEDKNSLYSKLPASVMVDMKDVVVFTDISLE
jgi:6-phosphogluconolactonase/glucosamine-6-phosphate isomerase/deaminase